MKAELADLLAQIEAADRKRAETMPTERDALVAMFEAYTRLKELGWKEGIYAPKDGTTFEGITAGSTGIGKIACLGEHFFAFEGGDWWPCEPLLFRLIPTNGEVP